MDSSCDDLATEFDEVWELIRKGHQQAWSAVNAKMIETYEAIGAWLVREVGSDTGRLDACAEALRARGAARLGFSVRNLSRMKTFHEVWSKAGGLTSEALALPWECHLVLLDHCATHPERLRFLDAALQGGWSAQELDMRIRAGSRKRRRNRPTK